MGANVGGRIAQRQPAAAAIRIVGLRSVQQQIAVNRNLSGLQLDVDRLAKLFDVSHCLIQHIGFVVFAEVVSQMPVKM